MKDKLFTPGYYGMLSANFLLYFGFWLLVPVLPFYLKENYGCNEGLIGIVLSCYTVSALFIRPFSGFLLDAFARKPLYLLSYFVFTSIFAGYIVGGTLTLFILLRIVHGFAFGTVTVGGNTVVVDIMPASRRGEGLGYYGLTNNSAMSIGPMVGLFLHDYLSFDWIFTIALCSCLLGFAAAASVRVPAKEKVRRPPISLDRFILIKGIPAGIALLLLSIPYGATTNFVAMYVKEIGLAIPPGFFFTVLAIGMGVSRIFSGRFVDRGYVTQCIQFGYYLVFTAFFLLASCALLIDVNATLCAVCFLLVPFLQGLGFGTMFPAYNSLYINLAPNNQRATATSTYLTSWDVGIGIGIVSSGIIAEHTSFAIVYAVGGVLSLVSMFYFSAVVTPQYNRNRLRLSSNDHKHKPEPSETDSNDNEGVRRK